MQIVLVRACELVGEHVGSRRSDRTGLQALGVWSL